MAAASVEDVQRRFVRPLEDQERVVVAQRLDDAEELIRARVDPASVAPAVLAMVEAEMVLRLIRNPDGYSQETDGNYSYSVSALVASGRLEVLPDEWRLLGVRTGVGMVAPRIRGRLEADPVDDGPDTARWA